MLVNSWKRRKNIIRKPNYHHPRLPPLQPNHHHRNHHFHLPRSHRHFHHYQGHHYRLRPILFEIDFEKNEILKFSEMNETKNRATQRFCGKEASHTCEKNIRILCHCLIWSKLSQNDGPNRSVKNKHFIELIEFVFPLAMKFKRSF